MNPIDKKQEICSLLQKLNCQYEIYTSNSNEDYQYLNENDICITIPNSKCEYSVYIDLEDQGEFTVSCYKWHTHYCAEEWDYDRMREDLTGIFNNERCVITINSKNRWLYSGLCEIKIDQTYDYKKDMKKLPKEFQDEIEKLGGNVELVYWNSIDNAFIAI